MARDEKSVAVEVSGGEVENPEVHLTDRLFRRLKRGTDQLVPDRYENRLRPGIAALSVGKDEDGASVQVERLLAEYGISADELCTWATHAVMRFPVQIVHDNGGQVRYEEDTKDEILGKAHAIIPRLKSKSDWKKLRNEIITSSQCVLFDSPPELIA